MKWEDLCVYDAYDGQFVCTLGEFISNNYDFDDMVLGSDGSIEVWLDYFVAAENEVPNWNTPNCPVIWAGLRDAINEKR